MLSLCVCTTHKQHHQGMNIAKDGWYTELGSMWPGQGLSLQVKEVLYRGKSEFQVGLAGVCVCGWTQGNDEGVRVSMLCSSWHPAV